jgi:uncharacterized protein (TIGR03382 family)
MLVAPWVAVFSAVLSGRVMIDRDGSGTVSAGDIPAAGVRVTSGRFASAVTAADGSYAVDTPVVDDMVWVRVPSGFRPGPVYGWPSGAVVPDLLLTELTTDELSAPVSFVVAADSHTVVDVTDDIWDGGDLDAVLVQALATAIPPRFFTILGDITQGTRDSQFAWVTATLAGHDVPWVPVPGNHDWYDGGDMYRAMLGPDNYSFDIDNLHFVVWDTMLSPGDIDDFLSLDLADVDPSMTVVALGHFSPDDAIAQRMADLGVSYLFTGHWHANRRVERFGLMEWGTQTLIMGGLDLTPGGYRVVTFVDDLPVITYHDTMVEPVLSLVSPAPGSCLSMPGAVVRVAASIDSAAPTVTLRIADVVVPMTFDGGWGYSASLPATDAAFLDVIIEATTPSQGTLSVAARLEFCAPQAIAIAGAWPQVGGSPGRHGGSTAQVDPPLREQWAMAAGGHVLAGSPVVAEGRVVVAVTDLAAGDQGGVIALDLSTGAVLWRYGTDFPVRNSPAVEVGVVVLPISNGEVLGLDLATGALLWSYDLGVGLPEEKTTVWSTPVVESGVAYLGNQGRFVALEVATGSEKWRAEPELGYAWLGSFAGAVISGELVVACLNRDGGLVAWNKLTGIEVWHLTGVVTAGIHAAPVAIGAGALVSSDVLVFANGSDEVVVIAAATGEVLRTRKLDERGFEWGNAITSGLASTGTAVIVPTLYGDVASVNVADGSVGWRVSGDIGPLSVTHYRSYTDGFAAAPVVAGSTVWFGDTRGILRAASLQGQVRYELNLGAPLLAGPAAVDAGLVVATYDGTVRLLVPCPTCPLPPIAAPDTGCGCASGGAGSLAALLALLLLSLRPRRHPFSRHR